jgi:hypothetical protein
VIYEAADRVQRRHGASETGEDSRIEDVPLDPKVFSGCATASSGVFRSVAAGGETSSGHGATGSRMVAANALIVQALDSGMADVYIRRKLGREALTPREAGRGAGIDIRRDRLGGVRMRRV